MYVDYGYTELRDDRAEFAKQLAQAMKFTEADLKENRLGRISTPQMMKVAVLGFTPFAGLFVSLLGILAVLIAILAGSEFVISTIRLLLALSKYLIMGAGVVLFGFIAFLVKMVLTSGRLIRLIADLAEGKVVAVIGRVTPSRSESVEEGIDKVLNRKTRTFNFVVKGEYFDVPESAHALMLEREGSSFAVYVTPRSRYLVGLEFAAAAVTDPWAKLKVQR